MCIHVLSHFSRVQLSVTQWSVACQAPLSIEFSRQEYWSGLPCPPPTDPSDAGIEPRLLHLLLWQVDSLPLSHLGSTRRYHYYVIYNISITPRQRIPAPQFLSFPTPHLPHPSGMSRPRSLRFPWAFPHGFKMAVVAPVITLTI